MSLTIRPFCCVHSPSAVKRLWGSRDYSVETQEMLQEKIELQDIKIHSVMELLQSRPLRWVVLTVIVNFVTIQLCGINAVSDTQSLELYVCCNNFIPSVVCDYLDS